MSSPDWSRVEEVFQILLNHPRSDWIRVIEAECAGEPALRKEIESLVEHTTESGPYFDDLARRCGLPGSEVPAEGLVGRTIGSYRLEKLLDRGGMGSVYLASRTEGDFEVKAAVKVVATGLLSQGSRRRFLSERRILAGLQHPNVTRLFDGGITEDGTPYFVMEYIDGRPIDSYCDEEELDIRERIRLFLQVCDAVEHAHRNLIVHRDLKPANILVDGRGDAKLLDFGIARALDSAQGEFQTGTLHPHPMTVAWASPEQLQGLPVSTGSDIYGLGLLLYRLVTGRHPYRVTGRSFAEMEEVVCRADPVPPHRVLEGDGENGVGESPAYPDLSAIAETRKTSPARLVKLLAGDLGHILMMALRKEPERRYRSVQALASDLRRYLDGLTVSAQPDTRAYRVRRFAARHKRAVAVGGVMIAMVLALVGLSVHYTFRTRAYARQLSMEAAATQETFDFLLDILRLADPDAGSGDTLTVRAALERGVEEQRDRFDDRPELRSRLLRVVAEAYGGLGMDVESSGLFLEAIALLPETGTLADTSLANTFGSLGISYLDRGRYAEAYSAFQQARSLLARAGADSLLQAGPMVGEGNALALNGQAEEAEPVHTRAYGIFLREAGPDDPKTLVAQMALARSMNGLGQVDSAAALVGGVVDRARPLGDSLGSTMANALNNLGYYQRQLEEYSEAVASYREALDSYARWISPSSRLRVLQNLASAQELLGDTVGLIATLKEGVAFAEEAWPEGNWRVGQAWKVLSVAYLRYGFTVESEEPLRNAVASFTQILGPGHGWTAGAESELGDLLGTLGRPLEAEPLLLEGYRKLLAGSGPEHALTRAAAGRLSDFYQAQGRAAEAARYSLLSEEG